MDHDPNPFNTSPEELKRLYSGVDHGFREFTVYHEIRGGMYRQITREEYEAGLELRDVTYDDAMGVLRKIKHIRHRFYPSRPDAPIYRQLFEWGYLARRTNANSGRVGYNITAKGRAFK